MIYSSYLDFINKNKNKIEKFVVLKKNIEYIYKTESKKKTPNGKGEDYNFFNAIKNNEKIINNLQKAGVDANIVYDPDKKEENQQAKESLLYLRKILNDKIEKTIGKKINKINNIEELKDVDISDINISQDRINDMRDFIAKNSKSGVVVLSDKKSLDGSPVDLIDNNHFISEFGSQNNSSAVNTKNNKFVELLKSNKINPISLYYLLKNNKKKDTAEKKVKIEKNETGSKIARFMVGYFMPKSYYTDTDNSVFYKQNIDNVPDFKNFSYDNFYNEIVNNNIDVTTSLYKKIYLLQYLRMFEKDSSLIGKMKYKKKDTITLKNFFNIITNYYKKRYFEDESGKKEAKLFERFLKTISKNNLIFSGGIKEYFREYGDSNSEQYKELTGISKLDNVYYKAIDTFIINSEKLDKNGKKITIEYEDKGGNIVKEQLPMSEGLFIKFLSGNELESKKYNLYKKVIQKIKEIKSSNISKSDKRSKIFTYIFYILNKKENSKTNRSQLDRVEKDIESSIGSKNKILDKTLKIKQLLDDPKNNEEVLKNIKTLKNFVNNTLNVLKKEMNKFNTTSILKHKKGKFGLSKILKTLTNMDNYKNDISDFKSKFNPSNKFSYPGPRFFIDLKNGEFEYKNGLNNSLKRLENLKKFLLWVLSNEDFKNLDNDLRKEINYFIDDIDYFNSISEIDNRINRVLNAVGDDKNNITKSKKLISRLIDFVNKNKDILFSEVGTKTPLDLISNLLKLKYNKITPELAKSFAKNPERIKVKIDNDELQKVINTKSDQKIKKYFNEIIDNNISPDDTEEAKEEKKMKIRDIIEKKFKENRKDFQNKVNTKYNEIKSKAEKIKEYLVNSDDNDEAKKEIIKKYIKDSIPFLIKTSKDKTEKGVINNLFDFLEIDKNGNFYKKFIKYIKQLIKPYLNASFNKENVDKDKNKEMDYFVNEYKKISSSDPDKTKKKAEILSLVKQKYENKGKDTKDIIKIIKDKFNFKKKATIKRILLRVFKIKDLNKVEMLTNELFNTNTLKEDIIRNCLL